MFKFSDLSPDGQALVSGIAIVAMLAVAAMTN